MSERQEPSRASAHEPDMAQPARPGPSSGDAPRSLPVALTIAGSDSGGGAGIQADLKTFHSLGVFGTSAVTAITAQNTLGVRSVHPIPPAIVRDQVDAVVEDLAPRACKSGMLATGELVEVVAEALDAHALRQYVLDPVMVASSGDRLLDADAEAAVARWLVPRAALVTPNLHEASILAGVEIADREGMVEAGRALIAMGAGAALVKGGHGEGEELVDVLVHPEGERTFRHLRIPTRNVHGTGCTLSAAAAAGLARGAPVERAVEEAVAYTVQAIATAPGLGAGHGPVNHFAKPGSTSGPTGWPAEETEPPGP